ncbi:MAG: hypothetical protein ACK4FF_09490 [Limnobacter sp.]|uniref:hypothetical protein n=1 Tax=Limnobacter sp. TaxID=2003368 RepID=UPI003919D164
MAFKHELEQLKDIEHKLEELAKSKDLKDKRPLEVKEIKGLRLLVSSMIRRLQSHA